MEIKKKIAVWCALFALLAALVPPISARANTTEATADDVKYADIEDFMHSAGYMDFSATDNSLYMVYLYNDYYYVLELLQFANNNPYICYCPGLQSNVDMYFMHEGEYVKPKYYRYYNPACASFFDNYNCLNNDSWSYDQSGRYKNVSKKIVINYHWAYEWFKFENLIYSDCNIYNYTQTVSNYSFVFDVSDLLFESTKYEGFNFPVWCQYAGLNCLASSNESPTKIPYSYNGYWHIVRRTSAGKWLLTTIGNSLSQEDMTLQLSGEGNLQVYNLYAGEDEDGYLVNVRQYEYDTDGWKVRTYETFDARETDDCIIELGLAGRIDDTRVLAYTSTDIYDEGFNVVHAASTEYTESTTPESPSEEITPTPTTAPSGGGVGGGTRPEVTPSVSAGQATVVLDRTGIYEEPSTTSQLQHYLYSGALVYVVDELENGWYYVRYEVGGLSQVGYVYSENIDYSSENGYASDIVGGDFVEKLEEMLGMVKVVPVMISVLFSFLPPWCLAIVGVGFSLLIALIIYKCARG